MQNKTAYTDFIVTELNKGNVNYKDVFLVFLSKFKLSEPTFVKYWKIANEAYQEQRKTINEAKLEDSIESEKKELKRAILTKYEAMEILSEIAIGKPKKVQGIIIIPNGAERRGAIETLAKIEGWNAPKEVELATTINITRQVISTDKK